MGDERATTTLRASAAAFARAFAAHAGARGWWAVALVAAGAAIEGVGLLLLVPILGVVVGSADGGGWPGSTTLAALTPGTQLAVLLAAFVGVMGVRGAILYARDLLLSDLQIGFVEAARNRVMRMLAEAPWETVAGLRHARVTNLMSAEIAGIAASAQFGVQGLVAVAMLVIQLAIVFALAPAMALLAAVLMIAGAAITLLRQRRVRDLGAEVVRSSQALMGSAAAFLGGLKAAAAENAGDRFVAEFAAVHAGLRASQTAFIARQARARLAFSLVSAMAASAVVLAGVRSGAPPGVLLTLIIIFARMSGPALIVQQSLQNVLFGLPSFDAVRALEGALATVDDARVVAVEPPEGPITLDRASFVHAGGGGIREVSLTIAPGEFVGIAGPSGAGKTSLVDLLAGLVVPVSGSVSVGGVVLDAAKRAGWRNRVGYVPQDGFLFHDSVRANLGWGATIDAAALAHALAATGADRVVARLEHGFDTIVGERGSRLSGGERQRIAIARALLRRPRLLVLDEATNAIDVAGEAELLVALAALSPRPTIVMVAHRAESLAVCDRVVTVWQGRVTA